MKDGRGKIVIISDVLFGGVGTFIENIISACDKRRMKTDLICFSSDSQRELGKIDALKEKNKQLSVVYYRVICERLPIKLAQMTIVIILVLKRILSKSSVSVFIVNLTISSIGVVLYKKVFRLDIPIVLQFHGVWFLERFSEEQYVLNHNLNHKHLPKQIKLYWLSVKYSIRRALDWFVYKSVDQIITFSDYSKNLLIHTFNIPEAKIKVLRPGLSIPISSKILFTSKKEIKRQLFLNPSTHLMLVLSRLEPRKGVDEFLKAVKLVKDKELNVLVILCSTFRDGSLYQTELFKISDHLTLGNMLHFINNPPKQEKKLLLQAADVVIVPSSGLETFGFVTLEAFASGTPVIAFNIGANSELINSTNGMLINEISHVVLAKKILEFFAMTENQNMAMRKACIQTARKYSWDIYFESLLDIIR